MLKCSLKDPGGYPRCEECTRILLSSFSYLFVSSEVEVSGVECHSSTYIGPVQESRMPADALMSRLLR